MLATQREADRWQHQMRMGIAGHLVDALIVAPLLRRLLKSRNAALAREAERGS